jgi:hypothetical protein
MFCKIYFLNSLLQAGLSSNLSSSLNRCLFGLSTLKNVRGSSVYPVCMVVFFVGEHWWWFLFSRYIDAVVNFNFICTRSRQQCCEFFCFFNSLRSFHVNNMDWYSSFVGSIRSELPAFALYCEFLQGGVQSPSLHLIILKILWCLCEQFRWFAAQFCRIRWASLWQIFSPVCLFGFSPNIILYLCFTSFTKNHSKIFLLMWFWKRVYSLFLG